MQSSLFAPARAGRRLSHFVAAILMFAPGYGYAQSAVPPQEAQREMELKIPPQPLADALEALARQAGVSLRYAPEAVAGIQSGGFSGRASVPVALKQLLSGTGLHFRGAGSGFELVAGGAAQRLAPVTVVGGALETGHRAAVIEQDYRASKTETVVAPEVVESFNSANNYDSLRLVPGVSYLWGAGGRDGKPSRIRGAATWGIADIIDGYPSIREAGIGAEDGGLAADLGSAIPAIAIESITVAKGGLGVLYASDADGGVIINKLKQGRPGGPRGSVWLEANPIAEQLLMADVGDAADDGRWDYYVAGKILNGNYDEVTDQEGDERHDERFYSGLTKLGWQPSKDSRLEFLAVGARDRIHYTKNLGAGDRFRTTNEVGYYGLSFEQLVNETWSYDLGATLWLNEAERFNQTTGSAARKRPEKASTLYANAYFRRPLSDKLRWSGVVGLEEARHEQKELANNSSKEHDFRDRSAYTAQTLAFGAAVLNAGLRFVDTHDDFRDDNLVVYDLGAAYTFATDTTLRATYSTGYSRNKGFVFFFGPIEQAGGVKVSRSRTAEIGLEQGFHRGGRELGQVTLSVFRTDTDDVPNFSGWGASTVYYDDTRAEGVELSGSWHVTPTLSLIASVTRLDTEKTDTTNPSGAGVGSTFVPVPETTAALGIEWQATPKLRLSTLVAYDDGMRSESVNTSTGEVTVTTFSSYTRWNAAAYYDVTPRFTVFLRGENLLDDDDLGFTQEVSSSGGTTSTDLVAEDPGRFFAVGAIYNW